MTVVVPVNRQPAVYRPELRYYVGPFAVGNGYISRNLTHCLLVASGHRPAQRDRHQGESMVGGWQLKLGRLPHVTDPALPHNPLLPNLLK